MATTNGMAYERGKRAGRSYVEYKGNIYRLDLASSTNVPPQEIARVVDDPAYEGAGRKLKRLAAKQADAASASVIDGAITTGAAYLLARYLVEKYIPNFPQAAANLRDTAIRTKQFTQSIDDILQGGPADMRAANRAYQALDSAAAAIGAASSKLEQMTYEDAVAILEATAVRDAKSADALKKVYDARAAMAKTLVAVYKENETISRQAERLTLQLRSIESSLFAAGNNLKPEAWNAVDMTIIQGYVKILKLNPANKGSTENELFVKALESSRNLQDFYNQVQKTYATQAEARAAIASFSDYLADVKTESENANKNIATDFPKILKVVNQQYTLEDYLIETGKKGVNITAADVKTAQDKLTEYKTAVAETRASVLSYTTIPSTRTPVDTLIDAIDPTSMVLGAAVIGTAIYRGIRAVALGPFDEYVSRAVSWPVRAPVKAAFKGAKAGAKGLYSLVSKKGEKQPDEAADGGEAQ